MALIVFVLNLLFAIVHCYWAPHTTGYNTDDVDRTLYKTVLNELTLDGVAGQQQSTYGVIEMCFAYDTNLHGCKDSCCSSRFDNTQYRLVGITSYLQSGHGMIDFQSIYQLRTDTSSPVVYGNRATNNFEETTMSQTLCNNGDEVQQMQIHEQDGYGVLGVAVYCIPVTTAPTSVPTTNPTTQQPTFMPTNQPTYNPTQIPSLSPNKTPSQFPTSTPNKFPSKMPSITPTKNPTNIPSQYPTMIPIENGEVLDGMTTTENNEAFSDNDSDTSFWLENMDFIIFVLAILILNVLCCFLYYLWREKRYNKEIKMVNEQNLLNGGNVNEMGCQQNLVSEIDGNVTHTMEVTNPTKNEGENNEIGALKQGTNNDMSSSDSSESGNELFDKGTTTKTAGNDNNNVHSDDV